NNCIKSNIITAFPAEFRGEYKANHSKATRWWKMRAEVGKYAASTQKSMSAVIASGRKRLNVKAAPGRGRRRADWVTYVYAELLSEFHRLKSAGVKFSPALLVQLARMVVDNAPVYNSTFQDPFDNKPIVDKIKTRWIQQFMDVHDIVPRSQTGKLSLSPAKKEHIEKTVAYHLGELQRGFASGDLDEDLLCNMDETHFVINEDNGRTLGFRGDSEVKYADVVSGGVGMTMMVFITGGTRARIGSPMMIFQNPQRSLQRFKLY
ncbi:hypothetical protein AaE_002854, partial [Aphanomyces astaci]